MSTDNPDGVDYDAIILDVGGDEMITLRGPMATPRQVAAEVEKVRVARAKRLKAASPDHQDAFVRWEHGRDPLYFKRFVHLPPDGEPLMIYVSAPALREALNAELRLGADPIQINSFTEMSLAGMIYGSYYSVIEPTGEPGSAHICDLTEITWKEFEAARMNGWRWEDE